MGARPPLAWALAILHTSKQGLARALTPHADKHGVPSSQAELATLAPLVIWRFRGTGSDSSSRAKWHSSRFRRPHRLSRLQLIQQHVIPNHSGFVWGSDVCTDVHYPACCGLHGNVDRHVFFGKANNHGHYGNPDHSSAPGICRNSDNFDYFGNFDNSYNFDNSDNSANYACPIRFGNAAKPKNSENPRNSS